MWLRASRTGACLVLLACGENKALLSLADLCPEFAGDVCEVRDGCCNQPDVVACVKVEQPRCEAGLTAYVAETGLHYDAEYAAHQRSAARASLDRCGPVPSLAQFFKGGLAIGQSCERDTQCASARCLGEPRVCAEPLVEALCPAPP